MAPGIPNVWLKISWDSGMVRAAMDSPAGVALSLLHRKGRKIKIGGGGGSIYLTSNTIPDLGLDVSRGRDARIPNPDEWRRAEFSPHRFFFYPFRSRARMTVVLPRPPRSSGKYWAGWKFEGTKICEEINSIRNRWNLVFDFFFVDSLSWKVIKLFWMNNILEKLDNIEFRWKESLRIVVYVVWKSCLCGEIKLISVVETLMCLIFFCSLIRFLKKLLRCF